MRDWKAVASATATGGATDARMAPPVARAGGLRHDRASAGPVTAPTFIDLFSGAGLLSGGMAAAGLEQVLAVEADRDAAASYARNVSPRVVHGSVEDLVDCPRVDVVVGGPPCQGLSPIGRNRPDDPRNALAMAMIPWIDAARPKVVAVENVKKFVRTANWRRFADALRQRGYEVAYWDLEASDFGSPQRRRRIFTVASRVGRIVPPFALRNVAVTAGEALFPPIKADDPMHVWTAIDGKHLERIRTVPPCGDRRDIERLRPDLAFECWKDLGNNTVDVFGRIDPDAPSGTLRCRFQYPSTGRFVHPTEDRGLSLREGARLQGIPDSWDLVGSVTSVAKQVGNGVPLALGKAVGTAILAALPQGTASMSRVRRRQAAAADFGSVGSLESPERSSPLMSKASSSAMYFPFMTSSVVEDGGPTLVTSASKASSSDQPA